MGGAITSQDLTVLYHSPTVGTEMIIIDSTGDANTNRL